MPIVPIAGPAGAGKSQVIAAERRPGDVLIDFTEIYAAVSGVQRGPDGRYPERLDSDPLLPLVSAVRGFMLSEAVRRELNGVVTTASRDEVSVLERITGQRARIVDPGDDMVVSRLMVGDTEVDASVPDARRPRRGRGLPSNCWKAIRRWFGDKSQTEGGRRVWVSSSGRRYPIVEGGGGRGGGRRGR